MLELLANYTRNHRLAARGFKPKHVRWAIVCDADGRFLSVVELGDVGQKKNRGQVFPLCPEFERRAKQAGGMSEFLVDTAEVVALYGKEAQTPKIKKKHEFFGSLLRDAGEVMPVLNLLAALLDDQVELKKLRADLERSKAKPQAKITFQVSGIFPIESGVWHDWWRKRRQTAIPAKTRKIAGKQMVCFGTGQATEPLERHPKVEGLADVGGLTMGDVLIGFDKEAFSSYGLEKSSNAAVSEEAAYAYRATLNHLIAKNSQKLAGARVVHWFKSEVKPQEDPLAWLMVDEEEGELHAQQRARDMLRGISEGRRPDLANNYYYALTLSGAGGRVMVRDWMEGPFEELAGNIIRWFDDLAIIHRDGGRLALDPWFNSVMRSTVFGRTNREKAHNLPPQFVVKMWRVAVCCEPIPQAALGRALARFKADIVDKDKPFDHARMGLMKAYFVRQERMKGGEPVMRPCVNEEHPSPAYHCGRLMAVLAKLQYAALGDVGAGVVQRYFAAASATPALVLGRLVRGGQFHLNKLDPGLSHWYEEQIGKVMCRLGDAAPPTLTLEEQSLFALGYYHQWVDLRVEKSQENN